MATPRRIYRIYHALAKDAPMLHEFLLAKGGEMPGTVKRLAAPDRGKLLAKWAEEMGELCGVLDGSHDDSYLMEATQTYYWATLYAVSADTTWEAIGFDELQRQAAKAGIDSVEELRGQVDRLAALGEAGAKPEKLFLLWCIGDRLYRRQTPPDKQWSLHQLMEADLQDMRKRDYLQRYLGQIGD